MKGFLTACIVLCGMAGNAFSQTKEAAKKPAAEPKKISVDLGGGVKMAMTLIPAGEFMMGSSDSAEATAEFFSGKYGERSLAAEDFKDEHPQHLVRITKPFYIGTYHVTRGQFRQFVSETNYKTDSENPPKVLFNPGCPYEICTWRKTGFEQTDEHPVVFVTWNDAVAFCKWLSKKEGKSYRLPTEAEWEYACRAGTTTRYYSGDDPETLATVGNVPDVMLKAKLPDWDVILKANGGNGLTSPVGRFKPNAFGLFDMHSNAWQWCADWYGEQYYAKSPIEDPIGPDSGTERRLRGGSSFSGATNSRSASRITQGMAFGRGFAGFRVARTQ